MEKYKVFKTVKKSTLPKKAKVLGHEEEVERDLLCLSDSKRI
jgi:hypothetical protein